jgi:hypothetical protein
MKGQSATINIAKGPKETRKRRTAANRRGGVAASEVGVLRHRAELSIHIKVLTGSPIEEERVAWY